MAIRFFLLILICGLMAVAAIGLVVWLVVTLINRGRKDAVNYPSAPAVETPRSILDRRLAVGEITIEQYEEIKARISAQ
jgi:uncharacterized membrane protein